MHGSENQFFIVDTDKKYDAIYIAQARNFKRMWLAREIESLYVLTYRCGKFVNAAGENDLPAYEPRIAHADWNKGFIHDRRELSTLISGSHAGLALSAKEGAMWASVQYLLCGIPVVTTPSKGGRHFFLDDNLSYTTQPTSNAVKKTVERAKSDRRDPHEVRRSILQKMERERYRYMSFLHEDLGVLKAQDFDRFYNHVWGGETGILNLQIGD
jgi:glycosyltransferase involved in cell wall biosynthesis